MQAKLFSTFSLSLDGIQTLNLWIVSRLFNHYATGGTTCLQILFLYIIVIHIINNVTIIMNKLD